MTISRPRPSLPSRRADGLSGLEARAPTESLRLSRNDSVRATGARPSGRRNVRPQRPFQTTRTRTAGHHLANWKGASGNRPPIQYARFCGLEAALRLHSYGLPWYKSAPSGLQACGRTRPQRAPRREAVGTRHRSPQPSRAPTGARSCARSCTGRPHRGKKTKPCTAGAAFYFPRASGGVAKW